MEWILAGFIIVVMAAAAVVAGGRWGAMPPLVDDRPPGHIPAGVLSGDDLRDTRFAIVPRGYAMSQVDELLARLADQLDSAAPANPSHGSDDTRQDAPELGPTHRFWNNERQGLAMVVGGKRNLQWLL